MTPSEHDKSRSLRCGKCRYPIAGLTQPVCPECGSDLRDVGVRDQSTTRVTVFVVQSLLLTAFIALILGLTMMLWPAIAVTQSVSKVPLRPTDVSQQHSFDIRFESERRITIVDIGSFPDEALHWKTAEFSLSQNNKTISTLEIELSDDAFTTIAADGSVERVERQFNDAEAATWLRKSELSSDQHTLSQQASELVDLLQHYQQDDDAETETGWVFDRFRTGPLKYVGGSNVINRNDVTWPRVVPCILAAIAWLSGELLLVRRMRRARSYPCTADSMVGLSSK